MRDDARLLDDVAPVLPTAAIGRGTISNSRNPQAGGLIPGGRLVVNFHDDSGWDHARLFLWPIDGTTWIVLTPDGDKYAERFADYSSMRVPSLGGGEMPEVGSVEFSRGWTLNELSELVREGINLALCARTSMGFTHDRDPTVLCDLSGRLFSVPPVTMGDRVRRRIVRKLSVWSCSCESTYTITRPDYSRWHFISDERTTSANASRTVGSSCFCEYGN